MDRQLIRLFLACITVIGVILVFRVPPMGGFDEPFHWRRAQQLADLHPFARQLGPNDWGGHLDSRAMTFEGWFDQSIASGSPMSVSEARSLSDPLRAEHLQNQQPVSFPSTGSFSPIAYLPSAIGIVLARSLGLGLLEQFHAGRVANLAAYLLLIWFVVLILPTGRLVALALLTMPTPIHLASSFSADPLSNGLPALLVACCLRLRSDPDVVPPRGWKLGLLLLVIVVGLLKPTCLVLSGLVLPLPGRLFIGSANGAAQGVWAYRLTAIAACAVVVASWNTAYPFVPGRYWHTGAEPRVAVHALISAPMHSIGMLWRNGWNDRWFWWVDGWGRFGGGPGPYHFTAPAMMAGLFVGLLLLLAVCDRPAHAGRAGSESRVALLLITLAGLYVVALLLAFRIGYGPPLSDFIDGVQGRYLLLPELLMVLSIMSMLPRLTRFVPGFDRLAVLAAPPLLLACLALDTGAAIIALGHYATVWH
ncbi:MAG: DUF2142 domain-containing protein [Janthinobacterium lividum]